MRISLSIIIALLLLVVSGYSQERKDLRKYEYSPDTIITYKTVDTTHLQMEVFFPSEEAIEETNSAILFFFGGGWMGGKTSQFAPQAEYYSSKGYVTFLVDYRVRSRNNTTPFESVMDAKSAMRFVKSHAEQFNIDSSRIIACGGSAGGHLAASTALISGYNDVLDDTTISPVPEALILFNPVIDNGPNAYGYERIGDSYPSFSPIHNIRKNAPPTIIFIGTNDKHIPIETIENYRHKMDSVGSSCEVKVYEGQEHGFFNYWFPEYFEKTIIELDLFLAEIEK